MQVFPLAQEMSWTSVCTVCQGVHREMCAFSRKAASAFHGAGDWDSEDSGTEESGSEDEDELAEKEKDGKEKSPEKQ